MPKDEGLKSAYELAMERLRAEDKQGGHGESKPLTPARKARIAELRAEARAKLAELEILHKKNVESAREPAELEQVEKHYEIDRRRVESTLESSIARLRQGRA